MDAALEVVRARVQVLDPQFVSGVEQVADSSVLIRPLPFVVRTAPKRPSVIVIAALLLIEGPRPRTPGAGVFIRVLDTQSGRNSLSAPRLLAGFLAWIASGAARRKGRLRVRDGLHRHSGETGLQPAGFLDGAQSDYLVPRNQERHHHLGPTFCPREVGWDLAEPDAGGILIDERPQEPDE
jgi:hypothetical protein